MNWDALGAIGELLGAAGVVVSLLYLATQMRFSNRLAKRAAAHTVVAGRSELNRFLASDADLNELFWKGMDDPDQLSERDWRRFRHIYSSVARHFEATFLDHEEGLLSDGMWQAQMSGMKGWSSSPGARRFFDELGSNFDTSFMAHLSKVIDDD